MRKWIINILLKLFLLLLALAYGAGNSFPWIYAIIDYLITFLIFYDLEDRETLIVCYMIAYIGGFSLITSQTCSYYQRLLEQYATQQRASMTSKLHSSYRFGAVFNSFGKKTLLTTSGIGGLMKALGATCTTALCSSNLCMWLYTSFSKCIADEVFYYGEINKITHSISLILCFWLIFPNVAFSQGTTLANKFFSKNKPIPHNLLTKFFFYYLSQHHPHSIAQIANGSGTLLYGYSCNKLIQWFCAEILLLNTKVVKPIEYISIFPIAFFCFFVLTVVNINFRDQLIAFKDRLTAANAPLLSDNNNDDSSHVYCCNWCACCNKQNQLIIWLQQKEEQFIVNYPITDYFSSFFKTLVTFFSTISVLLKHLLNHSSAFQEPVVGHFTPAQILSIGLSAFFFSSGTLICTFSLTKESRQKMKIKTKTADENDEYNEKNNVDQKPRNNGCCSQLLKVLRPPPDNSEYLPKYNVCLRLINFFRYRWDSTTKEAQNAYYINDV